MGYRSVVWDPDPECPASRLADRSITAPFQDRQAALTLAQSSDVVTYEFENIDAETVEAIEKIRPVYPGSRILRIAQHRRMEKEALASAGFPVVRHAVADNAASLKVAIRETGTPAVIKTAMTGYDGKGQTVIRTEGDLDRYLEAGAPPGQLVVEQFLDLQVEISVVAFRTHDGVVMAFPVLENEHRENILHVTRVPAAISPEVERSALQLGAAVIDYFGIVGVLCIEMFVTRDGKVLVNELAPRPHNSGHFSLDASTLSQFEALVRCVCRLPLSPPVLLTPCAMVNLLGKHLNRIDLVEAQRIPGTKVHLYGKTRNEPKRKMGHVTILGRSRAEIEERVQAIERMIGEGGAHGSDETKQVQPLTGVSG